MAAFGKNVHRSNKPKLTRREVKREELTTE